MDDAGPGVGELRALDRKILKYTRNYVKALFEGQVPAPSQGDCWFCVLRTNRDDKTLGDATGDTEHLLSHMQEPCYVPSLLVNAMNEIPVSRAAGWRISELWYPGASPSVHMSWDSFLKDQLRRSLRRYLRRRLGLAS